ncbi:hypothetical protein D3C78_1187220 [compost metagenome]
MGDTNCKDQEGHQHRKRVKHKAEQLHDPQLPNHPNQRTANHNRCTNPAAGIPVDNCRNHYGSDNEIAEHLHQSGDQVANQLGKTYDMQLDTTVFELCVDGVDTVGKNLVVQRRASFRIPLHHWHEQRTGTLVKGYQRSLEPCLLNVGTQLLNACW